jgi:hypothetical protein
LVVVVAVVVVVINRFSSAALKVEANHFHKTLLNIYQTVRSYIPANNMPYPQFSRTHPVSDAGFAVVQLPANNLPCSIGRAAAKYSHLLTVNQLASVRTKNPHGTYSLVVWNSIREISASFMWPCSARRHPKLHAGSRLLEGG